MTKSAASSSKKRISVEGSNHSNHPQKITKYHPFFTKPDANASEESNSAFQWIKTPKSTCLHAVNLNPKSLSSVAIFDLDGTLIKSSFGQTSITPGAGKSKVDLRAVPVWAWWKEVVPKKLKEVHESGYSIVIASNQALRSGQLEVWKKKVSLIAAALPDVPFRLFAATAKDEFRKPIIGMWTKLEDLYREENIVIDKSASFFVGDAAGRPADFAGTDRKWALNVGIPFFTPEEYFLNIAPTSYKLSGFHVSSLPTVPLFTPTSTPLLRPSSDNNGKPEIILFVGYPCLGKSSFYKRHFENTHSHINQDTLGSRGKCVKAAEQGLLEGKSCVIDNTNRDQQTRKYYIDLAKKHGVDIRCFLFTGSLELAWHNNLYRAYNMPPSTASLQPKRDLLPFLALRSFADQYEEPQLSEGFSEIKKINWVFEGSDEERRCWSMWLQLEGK